MKPLSKKALIGYPAGIITGIAYGLNPLFGIPLMNDGASVDAILFFRYAIAVGLLGILLLLERQSFKVTVKQIGALFALGAMFTLSSIFLFEAFKYIPSGLATTLCFLFPVFVALTMVFLKVLLQKDKRLTFLLASLYIYTLYFILRKGMLVVRPRVCTKMLRRVLCQDRIHS